MDKKTRRRRKEARPEEIIDAALALFAAKGFSATSMADIAAHADIARSTIYLYFDDKEALLLRAFQDRFRDVVQTSAAQATQADGPFDRVLSQLLQGVAARVTAPPTLGMFRILLAEGSQFPDLMRGYHSTVLRALQHTLHGVLQEGVARGEVRAEVLDLDIKLVIAPVMMAAVWQLTFQQIDPIDIERLIDGHVLILTKGIMVAPAVS